MTVRKCVLVPSVCLGLMLAATGPVRAQTPAEELASEAEAAARTSAAPAVPAAPRAFSVRRVVTGPSAYLPEEDIAQLARMIATRGLTSRDIPQILAAFDALYEARGITLAQATLLRSDAARGEITIGFVEARIGVVIPRGTLARPEVYASRIGLQSGDLADTRTLEQRLLRLAVLSGIRSEVAFTPGAQAGLTDLTVTFEEPQRRSAVVTLDSYGSAATGRTRATFSFADASLTGNLDAFGVSLSVTQGLVSGSLSYAFPVNADGTAVFATLSSERSRSIIGPTVRSRNGLFEIGVSHPILVAPDRQLVLRASAFAFDDKRDTLGVATTREAGGGVLLGAGFSRNWPSQARFGIDAALRHVAWRDAVLNASGLSTTYLTVETAFDTPLDDTLAFNLRAGAQGVHGTEAPAQFRGSLTGQARVRGYPSGQLSGDAVAWAGAQIRLREPAQLGGAVRAVPYAFLDVGRAWDRAGGVTTLQGTALSAGIGAAFGIGQNGSADIVIARPLRDVPGFSSNGALRIEASLSVRF